MASGAVWVFLALAVSRVLGIATYLVLARLLSPDDFGLVRFALILIGAFTVLQDLGVPAAIIHSDRDPKVIGGTALTINLGASVVLFALAVMLAPAMATLARDDSIAPVLIALSVGLVVLAIGSVQRAVLEKELEFRRKFIPEVVPLIVSGVTSIVLAFLGFGAWSLVWGYLVKAAASSVLLWGFSTVRPRPEFQPAIARELFRYGKHMSLVSIIGFVAINADYFIVGRMLGTYDLGLYTLAFLITNLPFQGIVEPVHKVMFPAYCRVNDTAGSVVNLYESSLTLVSMLVIPICLGIFVAGPVFAPILFGSEWDSIGPSLQLLACYTVMRSIYRSYAPVFAAIGRPEMVWRLNVVRLAILIPSMVLLAWWFALVGVAIAYVLVSAVFIPLNVVRLGRALALPGSRFVSLVVPQITGAAVAGLFVVAWDLTPGLSSIASDAVGSLGLTILSIGVYIGITVMLNPRVLQLARESVLVDVARRRLNLT